MISLVIGPTEGEEALLLNKKTPFYFPLLHLSLIFTLPRRAQVSWTPFLVVHGCTLLDGLCVYLCVCARLSELLCFKACEGEKRGFATYAAGHYRA